MRQTLAIPVFRDRVSPLFDASQVVLILQIEGDHEVSRQEVQLQSQLPLMRARELAGYGVEVLICGAISRPYSLALESLGIRILPFIAGEVQSVIFSYLQKQIFSTPFFMPGCKHRRRRHRGRGSVGIYHQSL
ncbi:MAG TPA: NifB/NifX family molybdenum-iron cluster-binding protein [bacterium]|nr:NifB/NifX family molybdenum-iron cluster-binding protein [bacterium]HPG44867.1 NifB/NifX family molybdenum-iron cluster-binding protein [bacterium]